ncbi:glutamine--fructose-6-phosphate aminotransferase [Paraburkholderia phytofirmans OLGA172]|uniref:Glutamine--fructose-6-phosphate aminotransferase [isomerizing] n=1 Tax=Paraburkholderia phytofirmans OLGA172 TaxID=1417228 RepID=A0A167VSG6_9BURK|nr:glutamine--fructose-6-phosphate transaminase (isomerizing) [Paraburkholderia phytofirmans]ANB71437.1 glutamine--fructose-6-phosphate aminotransferase [Paraburkholderia phytofirmans OLGA172]
MCGIVAGVAQRSSIVPALLEGLKRLEYRGYDSCGVAVLQQHGAPRRIRTLARVQALETEVRAADLNGSTGIAHTRWATHGMPAIANAHPIFSGDQIAVVHNGIIENHEALREALIAQGYEFASQTDTEIIAHLIHSHYCGDLLAAVHNAIRVLKGAYAIAVICKDEPQRVIGARQGSPLVVGLGADGAFLASDTFALARCASRFIYLEDGDIADLLRGDVRIVERDGGPVVRDVRTVAEQPANADLGAYRHYMQKEIFEQPLAVARTVPHLHSLDATLFGTADPVAFAGIDSVLMLGCGTSYFSALTARAWFESIAGIAAHAELSSEYRYRDYVPQRGTLVVPISQSGETADTLAALRYAQSLGEERTLTICNVAASAMVRQSRWAFVTQAGPEIGVASTKAFTTQLVALFLLALTIGRQRGRLNAAQTAALLRQLVGLPDALRGALAREPQIMAWAQELHRKDHALFIGRGLHYPIALEGALKMKEISYIHAEGYPAGELKHGPLALVTDAMPVIVTAPNDILLEKLKSNMQEVRARGGQLYVIADANTHLASAPGVRLIWMPDYYGVLSPLLHVVAFQLLAYHVACLRGTDVDKPRNLAKSVTVE